MTLSIHLFSMSYNNYQQNELPYVFTIDDYSKFIIDRQLLTPQ